MYQAAETRYQGMSYAKCGKSGLKLPAVSFGLWHNFGSNAAYDRMKELVFTAFDLGITHLISRITMGRYREAPRRISDGF